MIHEVSRTICRHLVEQLYPDYLLDRDGVQLCIPRHEHQDVQIGIYLYDISEYSITAQRYASVDGDSRVFPPKLMELSYLIFVNEDARFGGYNKEQEEILYEKMIQTFHDLCMLDVNAAQIRYSLSIWSLILKSMYGRVFISLCSRLYICGWLRWRLLLCNLKRSISYGMSML